MAGFPPNAEGQVTLANWRRAPFNKWSFTHLRELIPSAAIANDPTDVAELPSAPVDLGGVKIELDGARYDLAGFLAETDTDGMIVLRDGRVILEHYGSGMDAATPHFLASVTKSVLGLVAGVLAGRGVLDVGAPVTEWIPEVAETAWAGATLRDLLDMRVGILFDEDYLATSGAIIEYRKAQGWDPLAPGEEPSDLRTWFRSLTESDGPHGGAFHYVSPNTDLLGWVIERAAGRRYPDLVSELLWRPMGATADAYITVDRLGAPRAAGGMCATLRDLALIGQLVANRGRAMEEGRSCSADWIDDILDRRRPRRRGTRVTSRRTFRGWRRTTEASGMSRAVKPRSPSAWGCSVRTYSRTRRTGSRSPRCRRRHLPSTSASSRSPCAAPRPSAATSREVEAGWIRLR